MTDDPVLLKAEVERLWERASRKASRSPKFEVQLRVLFVNSYQRINLAPFPQLIEWAYLGKIPKEIMRAGATGGFLTDAQRLGFILIGLDRKVWLHHFLNLPARCVQDVLPHLHVALMALLRG